MSVRLEGPNELVMGGAIFDLDWSRIPEATVWLIMLPCVNLARSGNRKGRHGKTGGMYIQIANVLLFCLPLCFVHAVSDFAEQVNRGEELAMILEKVKGHYVVYKHILKMVDYGDACHRKRFVLVGFKRTFLGAYANAALRQRPPAETE